MSEPVANQPDEQRAEEAQERLARLVCYADMSPRSCCNTDGAFVQMMNFLNPGLTSCFTFESLEHNCLKLYKLQHDEVKEIFSKHGGQISLSVDLLLHGDKWWSGHEYLCLCAHFIDDNWKLRKWVIKYCCVSDVGMDRSYDAILKSLKEYDIEGKLSTLTVGGTSDMADYVKGIVQERRNFPLNGQLFNVQCLGDVISRMVQLLFKEISEIIDKVELLNWSRSIEPLWYLTSSKLSNALKLNDLGEFAPEQIGDSYEVPSKEEWDRIRSVCRIAERIYEITKGLFDIERPTTNLFLPLVQEIRAYLGQESANSDSFARHVAQKMLKIFNKYWDDTCLVLSIAAFLDPRFKMNFVEFCLCDESRAAFVLKNICKLYGGYTAKCDEKDTPLSNPDQNSESNSGSDFEEDEEEDDEEAEDEEGSEEDQLEEEDGEGNEERTKKKGSSVLGDLKVVQEYCQLMQSTCYKPKKTDLVNLDSYLEEPVFPWAEDFSVLQWWKDNRSKYPEVSKMARDFLAIPVSVATSYDAYYTEPREADTTLLSLKPELTNALKCTRSWKLGCKKPN